MELILFLIIGFVMVLVTLSFLVKTWRRYHRESKESRERLEARHRRLAAEFALLLEEESVKQQKLRRAIASERKTSRLTTLIANFIWLIAKSFYTAFFQRATRASTYNRLDETTVVGLLLYRKVQSDVRSATLLLVAIAIHLLLAVFGIVALNYSLILFLIVLISLLYLKQQVITYRLAKGYYGTNSYEVREIVEFILEHADKTDFTDGDGKMKLMPNPEVAKQLEGFIEGVVYS